MRATFEVNATVAKMAAAYALDAVDVAEGSFGMALDGSEASGAKSKRSSARTTAARGASARTRAEKR